VLKWSVPVGICVGSHHRETEQNGTFLFQKPLDLVLSIYVAEIMQRGRRGVDVAHPGLLDDEEEAAEGLAGVEEEGGRVDDVADGRGRAAAASLAP
jgi:hypothetical protein